MKLYKVEKGLTKTIIDGTHGVANDPDLLDEGLVVRSNASFAFRTLHYDQPSYAGDKQLLRKYN